MFRKDISAEITINATPDRVWEIFCAFDAYKDWNPFVKTITGEVRVGNQIAVAIQPPGTAGMTFRPTILAFTQNQELRWLGHFVLPGLFDGEHAFQLLDNGDGNTLFRQSEICRGLLVPFLRKMLDENTVNGFRAMNAKLKELAERQQRA
ncbi:MAG: SRPBCC domain-containing protein [Burkholderiaceae bacterium]|nr:SRPBCC domain-containing protein [Burkholderiaceae bacterium]